MGFLVFLQIATVLVFIATLAALFTDDIDFQVEGFRVTVGWVLVTLTLGWLGFIKGQDQTPVVVKEEVTNEGK